MGSEGTAGVIATVSATAVEADSVLEPEPALSDLGAAIAGKKNVADKGRVKVATKALFVVWRMQ